MTKKELIESFVEAGWQWFEAYIAYPAGEEKPGAYRTSVRYEGLRQGEDELWVYRECGGWNVSMEKAQGTWRLPVMGATAQMILQGEKA